MIIYRIFDLFHCCMFNCRLCRFVCLCCNSLYTIYINIYIYVCIYMCIYKLIVYQFYVYAIAIKYIFYIVLCNSKRWPYSQLHLLLDLFPFYTLFLSPSWIINILLSSVFEMFIIFVLSCVLLLFCFFLCQ